MGKQRMVLRGSGSDSKASVYNVGDPGSIPGLGRSPGEGNGNPLQDYCLQNPMDRGAWQATVHRVAELDTTERLHFHFLVEKMRETEKQTGRVAESLGTLVIAHLKLKSPNVCFSDPLNFNRQRKIFIPISLNMATFQIFLYLLPQYSLKQL